MMSEPNFKPLEAQIKRAVDEIYGELRNLLKVQIFDSASLIHDAYVAPLMEERGASASEIRASETRLCGEIARRVVAQVKLWRNK